MDYKNLVEELNRYSAENQNHGGITAQAADAITDLLSRAEAAEDELIRKESYYNQMVDALSATDSFEKQKLCEEADHLKDLLKEAEARAEKAERERDAGRFASTIYARGGEVKNERSQRTRQILGQQRIRCSQRNTQAYCIYARRVCSAAGRDRGSM